MLRKSLVDDQLTALKSGDKAKLEIIRYILAQIKNKEIEKKSDLDDNEILTVLKKIQTELKESIDSAKKAERSDLVENNEKQLKILESYLPAEISDEELEKEIQKLIDDNKELIEKNPKAIIGVCMKELKPKASPDRIMALLKKKELV